MDAPAAARCPRCGRVLQTGAQALEGLCPACLMREALASGTDIGTGTGVDSATDSGVQFTTSFSALPWTLVTLMADDEEHVTYLARGHEQEGSDAPAGRLVQLVVRKQHVPSPDLADARQQLRIRRDALRRLSHPALAPVLDGGLTDEGHPFLVTAFVMATPLVDLYVDEVDEVAPHPLQELLDHARAALQVLHDAGQAHGRVRSATVLGRRGRRTGAGATTVVTGYAPLPTFATPAAAIADDLEHFQRLTSTLRV
jgi:hypothetical protein